MKKRTKIKLSGALLAGGAALLCACGQSAPGAEAQQVQERQTDSTQTDGTQNETEEREMPVMERPELTPGWKGTDDTNPLMTQRFGADPYAMVYEDRVYIYMTADAFEYDVEGNIKENSYGSIHKINVISTDDMVNFTDHGAINAASKIGCAKWARNSWAPAAAWKEIDGKPQFFLYFADAGGGIGVLQSDSPTGPFYDPLGHALISRETPNCADVLWLFDPAVLMDDDGRSYLYFGGGVPEGKVADPGTARVVELGADMISIVGEPQPMDVPYLFEDSGIHKAGDKYYYTYCSNWQVDAAGTEQYGFHNAEIVSLESDSPMGPFTFKEVILQNPGSVFGISSNNHHCVFEFRGQWYIAYHTRVLERAMGVEKGYRATHIDAFDMQEDGTIGMIRQTLKGREQLKYVDAYSENRAVNFAVMGGVDTLAADSQSRECGSGSMALGDIQSGDFVKVAGVDFSDTAPVSFTALVRSQKGHAASGNIFLCIDSPEGEIIGSLQIESLPETDASDYGFVERTAQLSGTVTGVHDLYLIFDGEGYEIETWRFEK